MRTWEREQTRGHGDAGTRRRHSPLFRRVAASFPSPRVTLLLLLLLPRLSAGDAFDDARQAMNLNVGRYDAGGMSIYGGVNLRSGLQANTVTLFRGQASAGGAGCGAANFAESMKEAFESIPGIVTNVGESLVQNMPLLALCYGFPSLCDLAKHWQALVNTLIQFKYARCEQVQTAMAYLGSRLAGGEQAKCLDYQINSLHYPLSTAMDNCTNSVPFLTAPDGTRVQQMNLIAESLRYAGASPATIQVANNLLGEVQLSATNGTVGMQHQHAPAAMMARYEYYRQQADTQLQQARQELASTGQLSDATLSGVSAPGQVMPRPALDALNLIKDPIRQQALQDKLATGLALTHLTWECVELREQLAATVDTNSGLTEAARQILQRKLDQLERDLRNTVERVKVVQEHLQPAIEASQLEYARLQQTAVQAGLRAPSNGGLRAPFGTQQPSGFSQ